MSISMTLTLIQGHSESVKENKKCQIISRTLQVISIIATTVGQFLHDLDNENNYVYGLTFLFEA